MALVQGILRATGETCVYEESKHVHGKPVHVVILTNGSKRTVPAGKIEMTHVNGVAVRRGSVLSRKRDAKNTHVVGSTLKAEEQTRQKERK